MLTFIGGCGSGFSFDGWVCDMEFCFGNWRGNNSVVGLVALAAGGGDFLLEEKRNLGGKKRKGETTKLGKQQKFTKILQHP